MAATLTKADDEYVALVKDVANSMTSQIGKYAEIKVFNMLKSSKEVVKVKKTSEPMEVELEGEDMLDVYIYEKAFDLVDEATQRFWIENALYQVTYVLEPGKLVVGKEPSVTLNIGLYDHYKENGRGEYYIDKLELAALTIQQIKDKEKEEKEAKKNKKSKKNNY